MRTFQDFVHSQVLLLLLLLQLQLLYFYFVSIRHEDYSFPIVLHRLEGSTISSTTAFYCTKNDTHYHTYLYHSHVFQVHAWSAKNAHVRRLQMALQDKVRDSRQGTPLPRSSATLAQVLVEEDTADVVAELQASGYLVMGLTARYAELADNTRRYY